MRDNRASFDLVATEVLKLGDWQIDTPNPWGGDGFGPDQLWTMLSTDAQNRINVIVAAFREELGQDIFLNVGCSDAYRTDGKKEFYITIVLSDQSMNALLSYFPYGLAAERGDIPYIDFGDGWYFCCGDWT